MYYVNIHAFFKHMLPYTVTRLCTKGFWPVYFCVYPN